MNTKSFKEYIKESAQQGDEYEKAIVQIGDMFDWLRNLIRRTWGGERGRIAMDDRAKKQAVKLFFKFNH